MKRPYSIRHFDPLLAGKIPPFKPSQNQDVQPSDVMADLLSTAERRAKMLPINHMCDAYGRAFPTGQEFEALPDAMKVEAGLLAREAGYPEGAPKLIRRKNVSLVAAAISRAQSENDDFDWVLSSFAEQCIARNGNDFITKSDLRAVLEAWCKVNGRDLPPHHIWGHAMRALGVVATKRTIDGVGCHVWKNIGLTEYAHFLNVTDGAGFLGAEKRGSL